MPSKTHTTAVVLIPPEDVQPPIQSIRRLHDRNFERWMPHITLLYPFTQQSNFDSTKPILAEVAQEVSPFTVRLASFDAFKHRKNCTLFLIPEPKNEIVALHDSLLQSLPDYDDTARYSGGFNPHLSVGQFQHNMINNEKQRMQSEWNPVEFTVDSFSLIFRSEKTDDQFVVAETFLFSKGDNIEE